MVAENVALALLGGGVGVGLASVAIGLIKAWAADRIPRAEEIAIDPVVVAFALGVSVVTGVLLGLLPAWQVARPDLTDALKDSSRESTGGRATSRARSALLVAEVAVSFVLLVAAGLLVASFMRIQSVDPLFKDDGILIAGVQPPQVRYPDRSEPLVQFFKSLLERTRSLPGVTAAAIADSPPLTGAGQSPFAVVGQPIPPIGTQKAALRHIISPGFFDLIGVRVTRGRDFDERDSRESPQAIIINEALAKAAFPGLDPIGQHLVTGMLQLQAEVVGVVADTRSADITTAPVPEMYYPVFQRPENFSNILLRTQGDPLGMLASLRAALKEVDPSLPLTNPATYESLVAQNTSVRRMVMSLLLAFSALALLLSTLGVYSVMSYVVGQRKAEIGVRMAVGARPEQVSTMVVKQGLGLAGIGVGVGVVGALLVTRAMQSLLFETPAADPMIYLGIALLLGVVAALACWVPARRAASVDPLIALRH
jgi:putative ABC transport system permease protein